MVISNGANNNVTDTTTSGLPLNYWTHVEVGQFRHADGKYRFIIIVNDAIITSVENMEARDFSDVKLYASDNIAIAATARIDNLSIETIPDYCE